MKKYREYIDSTLCIICAKGNSKGLPKKNSKIINKKPLIDYAFEKVKANKLNYICVSTQDDKIIKLAKKKSIKVFFKRSKKLCNKNIPKLLVWKDAIKRSENFFKRKFKYVLDIEVTNPLLDKHDLKKFINEFYLKSKRYDGQFCITEAKKNPYFNMLEIKKRKFTISKKLDKTITARQNAPKVYEHVAGLYIFKKEYILKTTNFLSGKINGFKVSMLKSFDIDSILDFKLVELILKNKKKL